LPPLGNAGPTISYSASTGQTNDITVTRASKRFKITDRGVSSIPVATGCRFSKLGSTKSETCRVARVDRFDFKLGNKGDTLDLRVVTPATIAGEKGDDTLTGGRGDDTIDGGLGDDRLVGGSGDDTIKGDKGNDSLGGGKGDDLLSGADGKDSLDGGAGTDSFEAGEGDDAIDARDGRADRVNCGGGNDTVQADAIDAVDSNCETVTRT
jgi:Ca2+-binding RTX toxin-like protein